METGLLLLWLAYSFTYLFGWWRTLEKTGRWGGKCLIPVYNVQMILDIVNRPGWWILLLLLPPFNIFLAMVMWIDFAGLFGKGTWFAVGLWCPLTNPLFMLILGLGDSEYAGA